jgi:hypothetical protein
MKDAPPLMSENEADRVWRQGVDNLFSSGKETIKQLKQQVKKLQDQISQQQHIERAMPAQPNESRASPSEQQFTSRIFRQGRMANTADKNTKSTATQSNLEERAFLGSDQSRASNKMFYPSSAVPKTQKGHIFENKNVESQSSASEKPPTVSSKQAHGKSVGNKKETPAFSTRINDQDADNHADSALQAPKNKRKGNDFGHGTFWNRPANPKRKNISEPKAFALHEEQPRPYDLIVDTGASHVLFQQRHMDLLRHVELSHPKRKPFAILKAANGQILKAIGRGTFRIKQIAVVAYLQKRRPCTQSTWDCPVC